MQTFVKRTLIALSCASALFLSACNDSNDDPIQVVSYNNYVSKQAYTLDSLSTAASVDVMRYKMPSVKGDITQATALVMIPKTTMPKDGWRVVVWNHGTLGSGDSCAASRNPLQSSVKSLAETLLTLGYVVVAPDYEGLGTQGLHPYLHLNSAAQSNIAAMKAVKEYYGSKIQGNWMTVGLSQGGHAALGTAEYSKGNSKYLGTIAASPASNLGLILSGAPTALQDALLAESMNMLPQGSSATAYAGLLAFAAYSLGSIKSYETNFNYANVVHSRLLPFVEKAEGTTGDNGLCLTPLIQDIAQDMMLFVAENPGKTILDYPALKANFQENSSVKKYLAVNNPAMVGLDKPVMIIQGTADEVIPFAVTEGLVQHLENNLQTKVDFVISQDAGHSTAIVKESATLLKFIKDTMPAQ